MTEYLTQYDDIPFDFLNYIREESPAVTDKYGDNPTEEDLMKIYNYGKTLGLDSDYEGKTSWDAADTHYGNTYEMYPNISELRQGQVDKVTSPIYMRKLLDGVATLGTSEQDALEWRMGHNASLSGWAHAAYYGETKFDEEQINREYSKLEGWDKAWVDIKSTVISFMQPADYAMLGGLGKIGVFGAKMLGFEKVATSLLASAIGNRTISKGAKLGLDMTDMAIHNTFTGGVQLATYEGAKHGLIASATGQDVLHGVAEGIQLGAGMAVAMGIPGGGMAAYHMRASGKLSRALTSTPSRIAVQSGVFTTPSAVKMAREGEWDGDKLLQEFVTNYGTFGLLHTTHAVFGKAGRDIKEYRRRIFDKQLRENSTLNSSLEGVAKHLSVEDRTRLNIDGEIRSKEGINEFKNREIDELKSKGHELNKIEEDIATINRVADLIFKGKIKRADIPEEIGPKTLKVSLQLHQMYKELAAEAKATRKEGEVEARPPTSEEILSYRDTVSKLKKDAEVIYKEHKDSKEPESIELVEKTRVEVEEAETNLANAILGKPLSKKGMTEIMGQLKAQEWLDKHNALDKTLDDVNNHIKQDRTDIEFNQKQYEQNTIEDYKAYYFDKMQKPITKAELKKTSFRTMETAVNKWKGEGEVVLPEEAQKKLQFIFEKEGGMDVKTMVETLPIEMASPQRNIPLVAAANISSSNKAIIVHKLKGMGSGRKHAKAAKVGIELAEFIERTHGQEKHFGNLTEGEAKNLAKDYIQEKLGINAFDLKAKELNKKYKPVELDRIGKAIDKYYDNIAELMAEGAGRGNLQFNLKANPMTMIRKFGIKGTRKMVVEKGDQGLNQWWQWIKNQTVIKFKHKTTKKDISFSKEEADLITRILLGGKDRTYTPRPEELETIRVKDVQPGKAVGDIAITPSKRKKGQQVKLVYIKDKALAQEMLKFAKNKNPDDFVLQRTTAELNQLYAHVAEKSRTPILIKHESTGNTYRVDDKIIYPAVGKLKAITEKAGKGLQPARAFRYDYVDEFSFSRESLQTKAEVKGHSGTRATQEYQVPKVEDITKNIERELVDYTESYAGVLKIEKKFNHLLDLIAKNPLLETKTGEYIESKKLLKKFQELKVEKISDDAAKKILESEDSYIDKAKLGNMSKEQIGLHSKIESLKKFLKSKNLDDPVYNAVIERMQNELTSIKVEHSVLDAETAKDYKAMGKAEGEAQVDWLRWTKPHLVAEFIKQSKLGTHEGKKILGMLEGHAVKIAKGEATPYEIPHESVHDTVNYIKAHGTRADKAMLKRAMKKMGGEEAFVKIATKYVKPRMVDSEGKYLYPKEANALTKSEYSKMRTWLKTFWDHVLKNILPKRMLRGDALKEYAISRVGEMTLRGEIDVSGTTYLNNMKKQFSTKDGPGEYSRGQLMAKISKLEKDMKISPERKSELRIEAGWLPNKNGDWRGTLTGAKDARVMNMKLDKYRNLLSSDNTVGSVKKHTIPEVNLLYGPRPQWKEFMYNELGIKDLDSATPSQIRAYTSTVESHFNKGLGEIPAATTDAIIYLSNIPKGHAVGKGKRAGMAIYDVLRLYGKKEGREIKNNVADRAVLVNSTYIGIGVSSIHAIKKLLGKRNLKHLKAFDTERMVQSVKDETATKGEIKLFTQLRDKNPRATEARAIWKNLTDFYWKEISNNLRPHLTEGQIAEFREQLNKDFITDYFMRTHTPEWVEALKTKKLKDEPSPSKHNIYRAARFKAKKDGLKEGSAKFQDKVNELINDPQHISEVQGKMFDMINSQAMRIKNPHKLQRGEVHKEYYIDVSTGKKVKTYQDPLTAMESFIFVYSHYLGNLRYFPEFTDVGTQFGAGNTKSTLYKMMYEGVGAASRKDTMGDYALKFLQEELHLGLGKEVGIVKKGMGAGASIISIGGLFSGLSGIKNALMGPMHQYAVYERGMLPINTLRAYSQLFNPTAWHNARMKGQTEYGYRTIHKEAGIEQFSVIKDIGAFTFKWINFFKGGEAVNRLTSGISAKLFMTPAIQKLRGERALPMPSLTKARIRRFLEETFEFSKEQIEFVETNKLESKESLKEWDFLMDKIQYYGHVKNQGGTESGLLPAWFSTTEGKLLTIYQKIATTKAIDSYKNLVKPVVKHGNFAPMIRALFAGNLVGNALFDLHDWATGTEPPYSHEDSAFDRTMMYLYRSELLTYLGGIISPYPKGGASVWESFVMPFTEPMVLSNIKMGQDEFLKAKGSDKTAGEAIADYVKKTFVGVGQLEEAIDVRRSEHYALAKRLKTLKATFNEKMGFDNQQFGQFALSETVNIKHKLKQAVYFKDDKELKRVAWAAYNAMWGERRHRHGGVAKPVDLHKQIASDLMKVVMWTSPLHSLSERDIQNGIAVSPRELFLEYLKKGGKGYDEQAIKLHDIVGRRARFVKATILDLDERLANSVNPYLEPEIAP